VDKAAAAEKTAADKAAADAKTAADAEDKAKAAAEKARPKPEEIEFVARAMDIDNGVDWKNHPEHGDNLRATARRVILGFRACGRLGEVKKVDVPTVKMKAITWSAGIVTVETAAPNTLVTGNVATVDGVAPASYNGRQTVTVIDATHFTYPLEVYPGASTALGTVAPPPPPAGAKTGA